MRKLLQSQMGWAVALGMVVGAIGMGVFIRTQPSAKAFEPIAVLAPEEIETLTRLDNAVVKLTSRVMPSVVHIRTRQGEGSGVIMRADGYIITNQHVVGNSTSVEVTLNDGSKVEGKVSRDEMTDLAVVKVDRNDLLPAKFADSEEVMPGQMALAVGSPFGLQQSVTFGHVSALGRPAQVADYNTNIGGRVYFDMIQTDAAINPGNSGGPLLNARGEVIGINTVISSMSGASSGVGFAIPANSAKTVADQLVQNGKVIRAYLGLMPANMLGFEAKKAGVAKGAIVREVSEKSPASTAGMKIGDVIIELNGKPIRGEMDIRNSMLIYRPGTTVSVGYLREGSKKSTSIKLGERPATPTATMQPENPRVAPGRGFDPFREFNGPQEPTAPDKGVAPSAPPGKATLGIRVRELTDEEKSWSPTKSGVMVGEVDEGSIAAKIGIRPGMVVLKIGNTNIGSLQSLRETMSKFKPGDRTMVTYGEISENGQSIVSMSVQF